MQRRVRVALIALFAAVTVFAAPANDPWTTLMRGNRRYVEGHLVYSHLREHREQNRAKQNPPVTVLSCSDSRVPPELIFDQTIGQLFVVRVAGNVANDVNVGTIDYGIINRYTKMIIVMGHEDCGAVKAALGNNDPAWSPQLLLLVDMIRRNLGIKPGDGKPRPSLREATIQNARVVKDQLVNTEKVKAAMRDPNIRLQVVIAWYDFDGKVTLIPK
jgi:carbonic anhydrase